VEVARRLCGLATRPLSVTRTRVDVNAEGSLSCFLLRCLLLRLPHEGKRRPEGVYDTVVQRGGWSCSTVLLQLGLHG
jgi:hypothetical protein